MAIVVEIDLGVVCLELEEGSAAELDGKIDECVRAKHRELFAVAAAQLDLARDVDPVCPSCGGILSPHGKVARRIGTIAGTVSVLRRRLRCKTCGADTYPLDARLALEGKHTLAALERALFLATDLSYLKSSVALERLCGAELSHGQLQKLAKREGALVGSELEQMTVELFEHGIDPGEAVSRSPDDTLVVSIDGGAIPDRSTGDDFEAKVGVVYGLKTKVSKGRTLLADRIAYASLEPVFEFGKRLYTLARRHGLGSVGRILAIGDGAAWIRCLIRDFFPGAIYLLDLFHLKKRIREVLREEADEPLREEIVAACTRGDPHSALLLLATFRLQSSEQAEQARKLAAYIRDNEVGIANYARSDLFGSGSVEKAIDIIVSRRFKLRGMSWLRPGAAGMLKLRLLKFNKEWDSHWQRRMGLAS